MTRNYFKQGKIDEYRVRQLEAVNGWSWNPTKDKWEGAFNDFLEYVEGGGNVRSPDNTRWRNWVKQQRKRYFTKSFSVDQISTLESIEGWTWDPLETDWQNKYQEMRSYVDVHGKACVSTSNAQLGNWVAVQYRNYSKNTMAEHRVKLLEKLPGWKWP